MCLKLKLALKIILPIKSFGLITSFDFITTFFLIFQLPWVQKYRKLLVFSETVSKLRSFFILLKRFVNSFGY